MKGHFRNILFFFFLTVMVVSCYPPPEFAVEPEISFNTIEYRDGGDDIDTLRLIIDFQDGDGNLGLSPNDIDFPYHPRNYVVDNLNQLVYIGADSLEAPFFSLSPDGTTTIYSQDGIRPTYSCADYEIVNQSDTVLIDKNRFNKNIFVTYLRKRSGVYSFFDFSTESSIDNCGEFFDGRFPIFDEINFEQEKPLAGSIEYSMTSFGFLTAMRNDTFKIQIQIVDRNLNESNIIETPDFTLLGISPD